MPDSRNSLRSRRSFLKATASLAGAAALPHAVAAPLTGGPLMAYVGTFSSPLHKPLKTQVDLPPGNGRGIHIFQVDRRTGALTASGIVEMGTSPNCLVSNGGDRLYSTNETDRHEGTDAGSISSFHIDHATGQLQLLNTVSSGAAGPTHASRHPSGKFLLIANYFGGAVSVIPILPDGKLGPATDVKKDIGELGPKQATNAPPGSFAFSGHDVSHAHMIEADRSGRFVFSTNLAMDKIMMWKFDERSGVLTANEPATISLPPGDGPRHFAFHPKQPWLYSLQEEGSTIVRFDFDATKGLLTSRQTISSLPPGYAGSNFTSGISVSADGRFVYAANRLHDSIAWFSIAKDGDLKFEGEAWTRGDYPRSFSFDPTGSFLYCCNQRADHIAVFRVNKETGALDFTNQYTPVGNPSSITFVDLGREG
jgi:6-phosphogluconolactonase